MPKKVIQVPVDVELLEKLNQLSRKQKLTRSELIRLACTHYVMQIERDDLDRCYRDGYIKFPEEIEYGSIQMLLAGLVLPKESW